MRYRSWYVWFIIFTPHSNDVQQTISSVPEFLKQQIHKGKQCLGDQHEQNVYMDQSNLSWSHSIGTLIASTLLSTAGTNI